MECIIAYDSSGIIQAITDQPEPPSWWNSSWQTLTLTDTSTPTATEVWESRVVSETYYVVNGEVELRPSLTVSVTPSTSTTNEYTITATLNNPPSTPPTSVTFAIGSWTQTATLTNNEASITVQLHPSLANYVVPVSVSANGCVGASATIGGTQSLPIAIQVVTPSGGAPTVGPAASVAVQWLQQYYAVNDTTIEALLTNTFTAISVLYDAVFNIIVPALQQSTYTPITLSADQQNALSAIKSDVLSNLVTTLTNGYPSSATSPQMQFGAFLQNFERGAANVQAFIEALQLFA
ncbi:hypothetical protein Alches_16260 [Alicyclobacillus hesperidum subsp. aegles]|uniref:hypothetical protein n=1 Tax=Alicyclobacillus hesperidum TaxID=89784 RepID=UPI002229E59F|nr:hypothetical protein [Alicyclobacillus hesperidum]GLG01586.1 hypothetical protein Alches_16260 [Alicyclobacillus hesperidum subsp. aegles]